MGLPTIGANSNFDIDTVSVSSEDSDFPKENLYDDRAFTIYKPASIASPVTIKTDAGVAATRDVDYFGMIFHDLFTQGATVTFEHSADDISYSPILSFAPSSDRIIFRSFTAKTNRYFRLTISGSSAPFSIGQIQWGEKVEVPYGFPPGFDPNEEALDVGFNRSQSGNIMGSIFRFATRRVNFRIALLPFSFVRGSTLGEFRQFWDTHASLGKPFFFGWNAGDPGSFEDDSIFGVIDPSAGIRQPLRTPIDTGWRDLEFSMMALKE